MRVTAWNNGSHHSSGAGYGLRISVADRDQFFDRSSASILLVLTDGNQITVNTDKASFWNDTCRELISQSIGRWLIDEGLAPWPKGQPPEFELTKTGDRFLLSKSRG